MKTKGILVFVYRYGNRDCSAKGISHDKDQLILVGDGIPEKYEGDASNMVILKKKNVDGEYLYAEPLVFDEKVRHMLMFGGNYIYSNDFRHLSKYPIPIHDRYERG